MTPVNLPIAAAGVSIGIIATAVLDLWALLLDRALGVPITNWGHVGRWVAGMPSGTYRHESIGNSPAVVGERFIGWSTHYLIGIVYAFIYLLGLSAMSRMPSVMSAAIFGVATVFAPWLILQPGLGLGFFASRAPRPNLARTLNVAAHLVFGFGLYAGWQLVALFAG